MGCKVRTKCFSASTEALAKMYARDVLKVRPYISGCNERVDACITAVYWLDGLQARKRIRSWERLVALFSVQIFSSHVVRFFRNLF